VIEHLGKGCGCPGSTGCCLHLCSPGDEKGGVPLPEMASSEKGWALEGELLLDLGCFLRSASCPEIPFTS